MKRIYLIFIFGMLTSPAFTQVKNYIDQPYLETVAEVDTLVLPDKIFLKIVLNEEDSRNRRSTEEMDNSMRELLNELNIDMENNLSLLDFNSNLKKLFLRGQQVMKIKIYLLVVHDAVTVGKVLAGLENVDISNVSIEKTEFSNEDELRLQLRSMAILKAKRNAESLLEPIGQKVGRAIYISDDNIVTVNSLAGRVAGVSMRASTSFYGSRASEPMFIDFERIKFSIKIKVKFIIE